VGLGAHVLHGRGRKAIDLRIRTLPDETPRVFTGQADIACTKRQTL